MENFEKDFDNKFDWNSHASEGERQKIVEQFGSNSTTFEETKRDESVSDRETVDSALRNSRKHLEELAIPNKIVDSQINELESRHKEMENEFKE